MLESCLFQPTEMEVADLLDSQGISGDNAQLLAAVGVETLVGLSQSDPGGLLEELETANSHLGLVEQLPNLDHHLHHPENSRQPTLLFPRWREIYTIEIHTLSRD